MSAVLPASFPARRVVVESRGPEAQVTAQLPPAGQPNPWPPRYLQAGLHGHSASWESKDIQQRFRYRYSDEELARWAGNVQQLAEDATETHVVFNNCYRDHAHVNARQLAGRLTPDAHQAG